MVYGLISGLFFAQSNTICYHFNTILDRIFRKKVPFTTILDMIFGEKASFTTIQLPFRGQLYCKKSVILVEIFCLCYLLWVFLPFYDNCRRC